jgi:hypothetical protein
MSDHVYNLFLMENTATSSVYLDMWVNFVFKQQERSMTVFSNRMMHPHIMITLCTDLWSPSFLIRKFESEDQFPDMQEALIYLQQIASSGGVLNVLSAGKPDQCSGLAMKNYCGVTVLPITFSWIRTELQYRFDICTHNKLY